MIKMKTLFEKDPDDLSRVINLTQCWWVFDQGVTCHIKHDGTACMVRNGMLYKRYDAKINKKTGKRKTPPVGAIACCAPDMVTGHWPHWVPITDHDKWHIEAFFLMCEEEIKRSESTTYELCGPKVNGNHEGLDTHVLISHDKYLVDMDFFDYGPIGEKLSNLKNEGFVFHHPDGRMCKIRRKDFGLKWPLVDKG